MWRRWRLPPRLVGFAVCLGTAGWFCLSSLFSTANQLGEASPLESIPVDKLSPDELHAELMHLLSPANQRASCRSTIFPGGKCSCVDATPFDAENCMMVPIMDGKKTVCLDESLLWPGRPCLVYSFGIKDDLSFEKEMVQFGCTVHAFDPTIRVDASRKLPEGLHVHYIGIDGRTWVYRSESDQEFQLMTLDDLVRHLGHESRRIDYMKIDAEGSEWSMLRQQLAGDGRVLKALPQFTLELHLLFPQGILSADPGRKMLLKEEDAVDFLASVRRLEAAGFRLLESRADTSRYPGMNLSHIYETTWINERR